MPQQHRGFGEADLRDASATRRGRPVVALGVGFGEHDRLLGLAARAGQLGIGHDDRLLGLLAGQGQVGLALVFGNLHVARGRW